MTPVTTQTTTSGFRAATLAVGTEVVDGQIVDRNSGWISARLVRAGIPVIEHRAVADDRDEILRALHELGDRVTHLFVTGGLGPTSDDFTRELLAQYANQPLEFSEESWRHIEQTLSSRGLHVREIQKQQCYFPRGSRVLTNPVGTANAFTFKKGDVTVFALPGPPIEIAAIWELNLAGEIEALIPARDREALAIYRCLGRGESDIAELTEKCLEGSGLRVGYRAHLPYVEVKVWYKDRVAAEPVLAKIEGLLKPWIVGRDDEDAADFIIDRLLQGVPFEILDEASGGFIQDRIFTRLRERKVENESIPLKIHTYFSALHEAVMSFGDFLRVDLNEDQTGWSLAWRIAGVNATLEVPPAFKYKLATDRARRFITEKALLALAPK